jgi:hypothetical protein
LRRKALIWLFDAIPYPGRGSHNREQQ